MTLQYRLSPDDEEDDFDYEDEHVELESDKDEYDEDDDLDEGIAETRPEPPSQRPAVSEPPGIAVPPPEGEVTGGVEEAPVQRPKRARKAAPMRSSAASAS